MRIHHYKEVIFFLIFLYVSEISAATENECERSTAMNSCIDIEGCCWIQFTIDGASTNANGGNCVLPSSP